MADEKFKDYLPEIAAMAAKYPVLSKEAELDLVLKTQSGDLKARDKLLKHNVRLILSVVRKFSGRGLPETDLFQEGTIGFLYAVSKFDVSKGFKLSTYSIPWIRQKMGRAIANKARMIRIPIHILEQITQLQWAYRKFVEDEGFPPTTEQLAAICGIEKSEAEELGRFVFPHLSLDMDASEDGNLNVGSYLSDLQSRQPEEQIEKSADKGYIYDLIETLNSYDRNFLIFKFGLFGGTERTKEEVAEFYQMTPQEVLKKEQEILEKLREIADYSKVND